MWWLSKFVYIAVNNQCPERKGARPGVCECVCHCLGVCERERERERGDGSQLFEMRLSSSAKLLENKQKKSVRQQTDG